MAMVDISDAATVTDIEMLRDIIEIGERISIGVPSVGGSRVTWRNVTVIAKYQHHLLSRTDAGHLESFRWSDLLTVYDWRYLV